MSIQFIKNKLRYIKRFLFGSPSDLNGSLPPVEIEFITNFLEENNTVFDIGANIGLWSFFLSQSKLDLNIVSFEPNPNVVKNLEKNTKSIKNIMVEQNGVGNKNTMAEFYLHPSHGRSSFAYTNEYSGCNVISVPITTIDSYVKEKTSFPDFIKVDVEGLEPEVWEGMQSLIPDHKPKVMVFELVERHLLPRGHSVKGLTKKIVDAGYKCFVYDDDKAEMITVNVDEFDFPPEKPKPRKFINFVFVDANLSKLT